MTTAIKGVPRCVDGWQDVQSEPRRAARARKVLNVGKWNPDAARMVKYLGEFITLKAAPDMIALGLFPNGKEISESFGAFEAVRYRLQEFALTDPNVTVVCVGDGATPRTGATFAFRSAWKAISVDPVLRGGTRRWAAIDRLTVMAERIQDVRISARRVVIVAVHSHVRLPECLPSIDAGELAIVAVPCCVPLELDRAPDLEYEDRAMLTPCRTVKIWRSSQCPDTAEGELMGDRVEESSYALDGSYGRIHRRETNGKPWKSGDVITPWGIVGIYADEGYTRYDFACDGRHFIRTEKRNRSNRGLAIEASKFARRMAIARSSRRASNG